MACSIRGYAHSDGGQQPLASAPEEGAGRASGRRSYRPRSGAACPAGALARTLDPGTVDPSIRNAMSGQSVTITLPDGRTEVRRAWLGTDALGRDLYSRILYGTRVSLVVAFLVAMISGVLGPGLGLAAGYLRWFDALVMRIMAIPGILLASALMVLTNPAS